MPPASRLDDQRRRRRRATVRHRLDAEHAAAQSSVAVRPQRDASRQHATGRRASRPSRHRRRSATALRRALPAAGASAAGADRRRHVACRRRSCSCWSSSPACSCHRDRRADHGPGAGAIDHQLDPRAVHGHRARPAGRLHAPDQHRVRRTSSASWPDSFNQMTGSIENLLQTAAEKKRLEEELRIARQIQMSLLPRGPLDVPGLGVTALCVPAREVGGDYYDFFRVAGRPPRRPDRRRRPARARRPRSTWRS